MRRAYNSHVSKEVNVNLAKREQIVLVQKKMLAFVMIIIISAIILLGSTISAFAKSKYAEKPVHKYYTSIEIENGDTIWDIADEYIKGYDIDKNDYVSELCELNHLKDANEIHAGQYLTVSYYSTEEK